MNRDKKPLWRKENKLALHYRGNTGGEFRYSRHTKGDKKEGMGGKKQRGVDYTPLFKFLLSKVGQNWDSVYSEAISRLGESSNYSCLFVDDNGILQLVDPDARKLKLNNYYEVILSDKSTQICKFIQIIDDLSNQYICLEIGLNHRHNKGIYY
jgi:hypothetical protein